MEKQEARLKSNEDETERSGSRSVHSHSRCCQQQEFAKHEIMRPRSRGPHVNKAVHAAPDHGNISQQTHICDSANLRQALNKPFPTHEAGSVSVSGWPGPRLGFGVCARPRVDDASPFTIVSSWRSNDPQPWGPSFTTLDTNMEQLCPGEDQNAARWCLMWWGCPRLQGPL